MYDFLIWAYNYFLSLLLTYLILLTSPLTLYYKIDYCDNKSAHITDIELETYCNSFYYTLLF